MTKRSRKIQHRGRVRSAIDRPSRARPASVGVRRHFGRRILLLAAVLAILWITFLDSHSLVKRVRWHNEVADLRAENASLSAEIERLEREVDKGLSDEVVEEIAREHYGMRRPGETVYPVEIAE